MTLNDETPNRSRGGVTASADGGIVGFLLTKTNQPLRDEAGTPAQV